MPHSCLVVLPIAVLLAGALTNAASIKPAARSPAVCYSSETSSLLCYTASNGGTPQNVKAADIQGVADYLRSYGREVKGGRFFTMAAADTPDCAEWSLFSNGSTLALAKHLNMNVDSSVLFEDIATTIDGSDDSTQGIISCISNGGSLGVLVNSSNPSYNSLDYLASGAEPDGILVKIVNSQG